MKRSLVTSVCSGFVLLLASACAVGPDFKAPDAPAPKSFTDTTLPAQTASANAVGGAPQTFAEAKDIPADWWKGFGSEPLNRLMEQALKANPDLQAATYALKAAQENALAGRSLLLPTVNASFGPSRQRFSPAAFGNANSPSTVFTLYNASVDVSYGIDVWGGARRALESLEAQENFQRYALEASYLTLTGNVVTAAIGEASLREQIKETEQIASDERKALGVIQKQYELGAIAQTPLLAQQTVVAQVESALPALRKQLAIQRNQLAVLLGRFPSEGAQETFTLQDLHLPQEIPLTLPSKLVEQRPDIKEQTEALHAASAGIGVATAQMLPNIALSASWGSEASRMEDLFTPGSEVWSLGANLLQPIFRGGQLLHERRAAVAEYDRARSAYQSTVLSAFADVANVLRAVELDAEALRAQATLASAAAMTLDLSRTQYNEGAISYPELLNAEQAYHKARISLVKAEAARFADTSALFVALGGGWWNRTGTPLQTQILSEAEKKP